MTQRPFKNTSKEPKKESLAERYSKAEELSRRLQNSASGKTTEQHTKNFLQGRSYKEREANLKFNSILIYSLLVLLAIALILSYF